MTKTLNAKGKPFSWSYTALANYEGCPARYAAERFYCTTKWVDTDAIVWGNRVHKAPEQKIKGHPVTEPELLDVVEPYLSTIMKSAESGVKKLEAELEICFDETFTLVGWFSKKAWFRIKLDVVLVDFGKSQANYWDWKTGKLKDNPDQLKMGAAALAKVYPGIETFIPKFIWLKDKSVSGLGVPEMLTREDIPGIWAGILGRVARMQKAWDTETFPARPSFLCPWCAQYDECPNARRR